MSESRMLAVEWFDPSTGKSIAQDSIRAGPSAQTFKAPFAGDAVLYLVDSLGHH
jgi:hypothetical protein